MTGRFAIPRWLIAFFIPVVVTIVFWQLLPLKYRVAESSDYESFYRPVALQVLAGNGLVLPSGAPAVRFPPGYPIIIAAAIGAGNAIGVPDSTALDLLVFACIGMSSVFLYLIARGLWDGSLALLPSIAWSTYPLALWLTKEPSSEVPFTMLLFASALMMWRLVRNAKPELGLAVAAGALAGAAMLLRPIAVFLPIAFALVVWRLASIWSRRARIFVATTILVASAATVAPWEIHVYRAEGRFILISTAGAAALRDGLTFGVNTDKGYRAGIYVPDEIRTVMINFYAQYDSLTSFGAVARAGQHELRSHPIGTLGLGAMKLLRVWYGTDSQRLDGYILILQAAYLTMLAWAFRRAWRTGGERRQLTLLVGVILVYFWAISALALPLVRYMVPAIGLAFLLLPVLAEKGETRRG